MHLQLFTTLFFLNLSLAQYRADPPAFPSNCPPAGQERQPLLRFTIPTRDSDGDVISRCVRVGTLCDVHGPPRRRGCPAPTIEECAQDPAHYQDVGMVAAEGICIGGLCRTLGNTTDDQCDCLSGCSPMSDKGENLKCIKDFCHAI